MKSRKNRIVSLITAAFLLCSVIVPATRGGITARAAGFGAGLAWGTAYLSLENLRISKLIEY